MRPLRFSVSWLVLLMPFVFGWVAASTSGCGAEPTTFIPYEIANRYKAEQPPRLLRPGWRLTAVARRVDRPTTIVHRVEVIPELSGDLITMGARKRRQMVGELACPAADDSIWSQLSAGQDIEVELSTEKRGVFATVSCRRALGAR